MEGFGLGIGIVAGNGRKISPARAVTANAPGAATRATVARNSEPKIVLTIFQSNRITGSASRTAGRRLRAPAGGGDSFPWSIDVDEHVVAVQADREGAQAGAGSEEGQVGAGLQVVTPSVPGAGDAT